MEQATAFFQNIAIENILNFIINPPANDLLILLKIIFIAISAILLSFIIVFLRITNWLSYRYLKDLSEFFTYRPAGAKKAYKQWLKIVKKAESSREAEQKLAIIEADNFFFEILEKQGYVGETIEEKLTKISNIILSDKDKKNVLEAHKLRDNIVYRPDYRLKTEETKKAMDIFESVLNSLDAF